ncbi:GerAB/ArcD/ProY family transporter [Pseudalkalibacillus berkeleyi]|uniref:Spore germination protein n=1 Tax=Pseudalkalibacillus berkeleyi TaxID=1069813 RepID=A0ABS9GYQ1_9BACL|nr:endospore germination permease [Pseudalkalibacillus berkeleyi]MCF6136728.1 spore germination protein [Pseudalkalibacillus berkeleyi]
MKNKAESITKYQLFYMILQTQIGVGVLGLPFAVHQTSKSDGWISVIVAGLVVQILILTLWLLIRKYPGETIFSIAEKVVGPYFGKLINILYVIYGTIVCTLIYLLYQGILKLWVLPNTPRWAVMLMMVIASIYLAKERVRIIARFYLFVSVMIPVLIILTFISFPDVAETRYLFPIGQAGLYNILLGAHSVLISMLGFEMLLFLSKYVEAEDITILKSVSLANGVTTLIYVILTLVSYVVFSPKEIELVPQPVLYMLKAITFRIVERIDLLFISIWIVIVATSLISYLLFASKGLAYLLKQKEHKNSVYIISAFAFFAALIPQTKFEIDKIGTYVGYISYIFIAGIPIILLAISTLKSRFSAWRASK